MLVRLASIDRDAVTVALGAVLAQPDTTPQVLVVACITAAEIRAAATAAALKGLIRTYDGAWGSVVATAACALVAIGDCDAIPDVIAAVRDKCNTGHYYNWTARQYINEALQRLVVVSQDAYNQVAREWRAEREAAKRGSEEHRAVAALLGEAILHAGHVEAVTVAFEYSLHEDRTRALQGTKIFAGLPYAEATQALITILETRRRYVVEWRYFHDLASSFPEKEDWNSEQRVMAAHALARRECAYAVSALVRAQEDADLSVSECVGDLLRKS